MQKADLINLSLATTVISSVAAVSSMIVAWLMVRFTKQSKISDIHHGFQMRVREIQKNFHADINTPDIWVPTPEEKRYIRLYWYTVFDEWLICCKLNKIYRRLWTDIYRPGVRSAIGNPHFKSDLIDIFEKESSLHGFRREFIKEINSIYAEMFDGRPLIVDRISAP